MNIPLEYRKAGKASRVEPPRLRGLTCSSDFSVYLNTQVDFACVELAAIRLASLDPHFLYICQHEYRRHCWLNSLKTDTKYLESHLILEFTSKQPLLWDIILFSYSLSFRMICLWLFSLALNLVKEIVRHFVSRQ